MAPLGTHFAKALFSSNRRTRDELKVRIRSKNDMVAVGNFPAVFNPGTLSATVSGDVRRSSGLRGTGQWNGEGLLVCQAISFSRVSLSGIRAAGDHSPAPSLSG
jgi:hypothetical protein